MVHPDDPQRYLLGILLDGDNYRNTETVRDREYARQDILKGLGWSLLRLYSVDWWDNKQKVLDTIIAFLHQLLDDEKAEKERAEKEAAAKEAAEKEAAEKEAAIQEESRTEVSTEEENGNPPGVVNEPDAVNEPDSVNELDSVNETKSPDDSENSNSIGEPFSAESLSPESVSAESSLLEQPAAKGTAGVIKKPVVSDHSAIPEKKESADVPSYEAFSDDEPVQEEPVQEEPLPEESPSRPSQSGEPFSSVYKETVLEKVDKNRDDFFSTGNTVLIQRQIEAVLQTEAPVAMTLLQKRLLTAWGLRSGSKIEERLQKVIKKLKLTQTKEEKKVFLWRSEQTPDDYHEFRIPGPEGERREFADIPLQELVAAVREVLRVQIGLDCSDLIREVYKTFGFSRGSGIIEKRIREAINQTIQKNEAVMEGCRISIR